jgi:hypothetical protein
MKKCTYCGKEYPDEATVCQLDQQPLVDPAAPKPSRIKEIFVIDARPSVAAGVFAIILGLVCLVSGIFLLAFTHPKDGSALSGIGFGIIGLSVGIRILKAARKLDGQRNDHDA